jgi:tetratricopeptide (TPR) repeat protein
LRHALRSLELREEMGFKRGLPAAQLLISEIYVYQGEPERALAYCQQAEALAKEMGLRVYLMDALLIRADVAFQQVRLPEASEYLEQALALAQQLNHAYGIVLVQEKKERLARTQNR